MHLDAAARSGTISGTRAAVHFALAASTEASVTAETGQPTSAKAPGAPLRRPHNILHVSAPIHGRLILVSVFSRRR